MDSLPECPVFALRWQDGQPVVTYPIVCTGTPGSGAVTRPLPSLSELIGPPGHWQDNGGR